MYKLSDKKRSADEALKLSKEFDYNLNHGKIPLGIFYHDERKALEDKWPQLSKLMKKNKCWKDLKR
jgi:hypothetical protein